MSELSVEKISNKTGTGPTDFADGLTVDGVTLESNYGFVPMTLIESNGTPSDSASNRGNLWWNDSDGTLAIYNNNAWLGISGEVSGGGAAATAIYGDRAIIFNSSTGASNSTSNIIEYYDITTPGNASDFGDMLETAGNSPGAAVTNGTYAVCQVQSTTASYRLQYVTTATIGNATSFGDNTILNLAATMSTSEGTYGYFAHGYTSSNVIGVISVAVPGNMSDTGYDLSTNQYEGHGCGNTTYGLFGGGKERVGLSANNVPTICYITYASLATAVDFGDLTTTRYREAAVASDTRGVWAGGYISSGANTIDYVTIDTPGNASDFGDLTQGRYPGAAGNGTYGTFLGGYTGSSRVNTIDYITIDTTGNASDFGDLSAVTILSYGTSGDAA
jgi:hypothetical protein